MKKFGLRDCVKLLAVWIAFGLLQSASAAELVPRWIAVAGDTPPGLSYFRKSLYIAQPVTSATIVAAGDSAGVDFYLDGKLLYELDAYDPLLKLDVTQELTAGKHLLAARCRHASTDAAFFLRLQLKFADGTQQVVLTDNSWRCSTRLEMGWEKVGFAEDDWMPCFARAAVDERLLVPEGRGIDLAASDNYEQWRQASGSQAGPNPAKFSIAEGFQIEQVRLAAADEDSWISLVFDPQGRAIISQEQQGLLRMTLGAEGHSVQTVERINPALREVRGMAFAGSDLYLNANNSKAMYRMRGDSQGNFGTPELLFSTAGDVGHGRNDLTVGPDSKIYSIHGDSVVPPELSKDYTLKPLQPRPASSPGRGHLVRFDPTSAALETLVSGLRNPYGIAFNPDGEAFTYDADAELDMGAPWYRPTRVNHLTIGADFGWRSVTGQWPPYYPDHPDNAPALLDIGKGSPTAVRFGTRSNYPQRYRQALFILDWTYGRILAVHCLPHGASYLCEAEAFLKGRPLNVTDLDFAPDGSMYLITGGRKTQSALYRIRYAGASGKEDEEEADALPSSASAAPARQHRRELEAMLSKDALADDVWEQMWRALGHGDPRIRYAARTVLERQPVERWRQRALNESSRLRSLTAIAALVQQIEAADRAAILKKLNATDLTDATHTERLLAAWIYHRCVAEGIELEPVLTQAVRDRLEDLYPDRSYPVNVQLSLALARLPSEKFVGDTLRLLYAATDQHQQMHHLFVLHGVTVGWTDAARQDYFAALASTRQFVGGEGMPGFLDRIRSEALASVADEHERSRYAALLTADPAALDTPLAPRAFVRKWTVSDAISATQSVGGEPNATRGAELFAAASCSKCHRAGQTGTSIGPDLTSVSSRFSRQDILQSIVEPSKVIAENYRSLQVLTADGKTYVGRPVVGGDYRSQTLRLALNPQRPFEVTEIDKRTIEQEQVSPVSWMPDGLLDSLSAEEIRDLLVFLEAGARNAVSARRGER